MSMWTGKVRMCKETFLWQHESLLICFTMSQETMSSDSICPWQQKEIGRGTEQGIDEGKNCAGLIHLNIESEKRIIESFELEGSAI